MSKKTTGKRITDHDGSVRIAAKNANGMGSTYRVGAGWKATYYDPTTGKRRTASGRTKALAEARRDEKLEEARRRSPHGRLGDNPTIGDLAEWWLDNVAAVTVRPATLHAYGKDVARIVDYSGASPAADLDTEIVRGFLAALVRQGRAVGTIRNARARLRQIAESAVELGYIVSNPVPRVPLPKVAAEAQQRRRTLTPDETRRLLAGLTGDRAYDAAVALLFTTGMRISEALGLAWSDIDLEAGTATIRRACTYTGGGVGSRLDAPKTQRTAGAVHLSPTAVSLLRKRRKRQAAERLAAGEAWETITYQGEDLDLVFTTPTGALVNRQTVSKTIRLACEAAGVDPAGVGTHTGRRSVATNLFVAGLAVDDVARHVGHSDPATTAQYVQDLGERPADTARRAAELLDPAAGMAPPN